MPRVSLPSTLKSLKTYDVLLTQTTEDDLRSHFKIAFELFESGKSKYTTRISDVVGMFLESNPYVERDWKKHVPTRHYKETFAWFGENENEMQEYFNFSSLLSDLNVISRHYEWEELDDMKFEVQKFTDHILTSQKDILQLESCRFFQAKKSFEEENKDWIQEQAEIKIHKQNHHSGYGLRIKEEDGEIIDLSCKYCKLDYDKEIESVRRHKEYLNSKLEPKQETKIESIVVETKSLIKPTEQVCKDCGFKSYYKSVFEYHKQESEHKQAIKLKSWYCTCCEVQLQTQIKYNDHIETLKHKKNIGEIHKPHYSCEKCNYNTKFKHHYDQHIQSIKHKEIENK